MYKVGINLKQRDLIAVLCALSTTREPLAQQVVDLVTTTAPKSIDHNDAGQEVDALYVIPMDDALLACIDRVSNYYDGTLHNLASDIKDVRDEAALAPDASRVQLCIYPNPNNR